jgi:hypothetical protein
LHSSSLFASTQQVHKSRSQPPLPFDMSKFALENCFLALGVCFPQSLLERRPHVCCVKITITIRMNCYTITNSMKCLVNWIPLRIFVRSTNTQPHFKVGLSILKWTQFLSRFQFTRHFIGFVVVETKWFVGSNPNNLDAANMWPALKHVCGKIRICYMICFHHNDFDKMPCKRDSTENKFSFEKYLTPPTQECANHTIFGWGLPDV